MSLSDIDYKELLQLLRDARWRLAQKKVNTPEFQQLDLPVIRRLDLFASILDKTCSGISPDPLTLAQVAAVRPDLVPEMYGLTANLPVVTGKTGEIGQNGFKETVTFQNIKEENVSHHPV